MKKYFRVGYPIKPTKQFNFSLPWFGTITSVVGSFLVALTFPNFGYILFLLGSASWLIIGFKRKDIALVTLNFTFFIANIIGLFNYTFGA